jgi:hypothetical protein
MGAIPQKKVGVSRLYPILIRLADRGLVAARWEDGQPAGRPRRHQYQLTPEGLAAAKPPGETSPASQAPTRHPPARTRPDRPSRQQPVRPATSSPA